MDGTHSLYPFTVDGHLGCFYPLTIVNSAIISKRMYISVWIRSLNYFGYIPGRGVAGSYGKSTVNFLRTHQIISL